MLSIQIHALKMYCSSNVHINASESLEVTTIRRRLHHAMMFTVLLMSYAACDAQQPSFPFTSCMLLEMSMLSINACHADGPACFTDGTGQTRTPTQACLPGCCRTRQSLCHGPSWLGAGPPASEPAQSPPQQHAQWQRAPPHLQHAPTRQEI